MTGDKLDAVAVHTRLGVGSDRARLLETVVRDGGLIETATTAPGPDWWSFEAAEARLGGYRPGELVTVFASVAETLALVHAAGWVHGAVSARTILLDSHGVPRLGGWAHAVLAQGQANRRRREPRAVEAAELAELVRARVELPDEGLEAALDACAVDVIDTEGGALLALVDALHTWHGATAVRDPAVEPLRPSHDDTDTLQATPVATRRKGAAPPSAQRRRARVSVILAGVTVLCLALTGLMLFTPRPGAEPPPTLAASVADDPPHADGITSSPAPPDPSPAPPSHVSADVVPAAAALLRARDAAHASDDAAQLTSLFSDEAPGLDAELARLDAPTPAAPLAGHELRLVDRYGGLAVIELRHGATRIGSVTIVLHDEAWRLRWIDVEAST